jgi:hypothetical protein
VTKGEELRGLKEEGRGRGRVKRGGNMVGIRGWVKFGGKEGVETAA